VAKIKRLVASKCAMTVTAADATAVKPITLILHKFGSTPVSLPIPAQDQARFVSGPVTAIVARARRVRVHREYDRTRYR
jgi:hypothetical protein